MRIKVYTENCVWLETSEMTFEDACEEVNTNGLHTADEDGPVYVPSSRVRLIRLDED